MQERIAEYVATLKVKSIPDYETPARECSAYFDGRGIDMPNDSDWEAFKEYFKEKYKREKGKDISPTTLQQNYVARGKAFYRWCNGQQDDNEQTASLFDEGKTEASNTPEPEAEKPRPTEASRPPAPDEEAENYSEIAEDTETPSPQNKPVRLSFLLDPERYEVLALLSVLEHKTMTEILTAGADMYIRDKAKQAEILSKAIKEARSK